MQLKKVITQFHQLELDFPKRKPQMEFVSPEAVPIQRLNTPNGCAWFKVTMSCYQLRNRAYSHILQEVCIEVRGLRTPKEREDVAIRAALERMGEYMQASNDGFLRPPTPSIKPFL